MTTFRLAPDRAGPAETMRPANLNAEQAEGGREPLFLFPGLSGAAAEVAALAARLGDQRPVRVLETCRADEDGVLASTVGDMATAGLSMIRRTQPRGPYHLIGYSFGGLLAFEIARRLKLAGDDVALLGLIDAPYGQRYWPAGVWLRSQALRIASHGGRLATLPPPAALAQLRYRAGRLFDRLAVRWTAASTPAGPVQAASGSGVDVIDAGHAAMEGYRPPYYPGVVTLFNSSTDSGFHCDLARLWRDRAAVVEARAVSGHHLDLVRDPACLDQLARAIGDRLDALSAPADIEAATTAQPRVLVTTTLRWLSTARIALAFAEAGFLVEALCPSGHALDKMEFLDRAHRFSALSPLRGLRRAIDVSTPDLIVPCDDRAAGQLHRLCARLNAGDPASEKVRALIARSLGEPSGFPVLHSRVHMMALARAERLRCPQTDGVESPEALRAWLARFGFPAVIKTDGSWGGEGVAVVRDVEDALRAYARLGAPPPLARVVKRLLVDQDANLLRPWWRRQRPAVSLQAFVPGAPANVAVACWRGEVLAITAMEAIRTTGATGHATVVKRIDHPEMLRAALKVVDRLKLSGLCGLDFILDAERGDAHLIEVNARATPTCHLPAGDGLNLVAALRARLTGRSALDHDDFGSNRSKIINVIDSKHLEQDAGGKPLRTFPHPALGGAPAKPGEIVALFPHELIRDPRSPFLKAVHHDVPWQSLSLVRLGLALQRRKHGVVARWLRGAAGARTEVIAHPEPRPRPGAVEVEAP